MNKPALNQLKNKPAFKLFIGLLIVLLIIKLGSAGYEFGQWLKTK
jgi:hypothetical protein